MKDYYMLFLFVFSGFLINAQSETQITSAKVTFNFENNDVDGSLAGFASESYIDFEQIQNSKFKGSVEVATIRTGNAIRDWSLKRSKYFDIDHYPKITFESTKIQQQNDRIIVTGKIKIKNTLKAVSFDFEKKNQQLIGKTTIFTSDYGIKIKSEREKNKVLVQLVMQLK